MFMEKFFKEQKLHACTELRSYEQPTNVVSGFFSQNSLASSIDSCETVYRFNQGGHIQMSRL